MDQQEETEWDGVNKLLQHHGFKPVYFADPVENKNLSDLVLLDKRSAVEIRTTLRTMLTDSERRQALIQELIQSNNQLKEEAQEHMSRAACQSQRATELEELLDGVKAKVQDLEDRYLSKAVQQRSQTQQLQQEKQEAQKRCQALEQKLSEQSEAVSQLQRKLYFTVKEEERRLARQSRAILQISKKTSQQNTPTDQQVLDVIDFYETQMMQLLDDLRSPKGEPVRCRVSSVRKAYGDVTPSFKAILKYYQQQQMESKAQKEELQKEIQHLQQELETRPTAKELRSHKHQHLCLDRFNKHKKTRLPKEDNRTERHSCGAGNISEQNTASFLCAQYHQLLTEISAVVSSPKAPLRLHRQKPTSISVELADFQSVLPVLEAWAQQLHSLRDLHNALRKLSVRLMPWQPDGGHDAAEAVKVEDMMLLVDTLLEDTSTDSEKVLRSPTRHTLESMVSHFQKLFDVASLSGVYPRMNELYTRLGEMSNTMRNLRDILQLDDKAPAAEVVNQVTQLLSSAEDGVGLQLHSLLGDEDIDSVIVKVKQHDEFFPAFHSLVLELLQTLGVSRLDDIVPALSSLKLRAQ
ncbi:centrosomal protein of 70 kDa [Myripristis murdjan]|uniref:Centrosomal protein of 70 kDa n=1 Tax=Myripristis murdjan TaxID=586833 RepID=A0A667WFS1_9TELE|nr:centrosomal protein of 70 kDa [Myripristis murdjan]XP_029924283.1 centrosomal protein of 70 kDa [Myripristis murdjan]XP_029924293.1 centrosomal protein of 70 kDa [Myripristis murdjan]